MVSETAGADPRVDPRALVAAIREEVTRRRAAGGYPEELLRRLEAEFTPADAAPPLDALAHLETVHPLHSTRALGGQVVVAAKRTIRRAIAWYVRPITEDQTRFNFGVVRRLLELEERIARLEEAAATQVPAEPQGPPAPEA